MSREIKFRGYDKEGKQMVPQQGGCLSIAHTGRGEYGFNQGYGRLTIEPEYLMQFTGLKDKNGVEIYEGDILIDVSDYSSVEGNWEVYWDSDCWFLRSNGFGYDNGDYYRGDDITWEDFEVIGNIHENPELLGGEDGN